MLLMFSLVMILLLVLLIVGGGLLIATRYTGLWSPGDRFAQALPALVTLLAVFAACLVGWLLAIAFAPR
jgi:hypothetical protein